MGEEKLLTVGQVADRLQLRIETVRRYIADGTLLAVELPGGQYRIAETELEKILKPVAKGVINDTGTDGPVDANNRADR